MTTFSILDETPGGTCRDAGTLAIDASATSLREIIRLRVQQEVERFNQSETKIFQGLIQPDETELLLNGARPVYRSLDCEQQFAKAIRAFQGNGFLVFVDDQQITDLDEAIHLQPQSKVAFLRLVPLVGG